MSSELDPLLPENEPAPEISADYDRRNRSKKQSHVVEGTKNDKDSDANFRSTGGDGSQLRVMIGLFICVVGLGLLISSLSSNALGERRKSPKAPRPGQEPFCASGQNIVSKPSVWYELCPTIFTKNVLNQV